jgi:hypothetical protein
VLSLYLSNGPSCYPGGIDGIMLTGGRDRPYEGSLQEEETRTSAENVALVRRYVEEVYDHRELEVEDLFASDFTLHDPLISSPQASELVYGISLIVAA